MKKRFDSRFQVVCVSVIVWIISLFQDAITYSDYNGMHQSRGWEFVIIGSTAILGSAFLEWIIWLANPIFVMSIVFFLQKKQEAKVSSVIALCLALFFMFWNRILISDAGDVEIIQKNAGYWLWMLSILVLTLGIYKYLPSTEKNNIGAINKSKEKTEQNDLSKYLIDRIIVQEYKNKYLKISSVELKSISEDKRFVPEA